MDEEEKKRIENFIKGSKFEQTKKSIWNEFHFLEKQHGDTYNRIIWLVFFTSILSFAYIIGNNGALGIFPLGEWDIELIEFENFNVEHQLQNISHEGNLMIIETEWMQFNGTINNNHEKDVGFKLYTTVSNSGENTFTDVGSEIFVSKGESIKFIKKFPLKNEGLNTVYLSLKMYEVFEDGRNKGKINTLKEIESESISKFLRVYSFSDFNAIHDQSIIYKFLWIVVAPFAAITIKHLRDLFEGR